MKQHRSKHTPKPSYRVVDIKKEIPEKQLAALGAMALAFNEAEAAIDRLFYIVTELSTPLQLEVSTRINGIDGKVGIIKKGAEQFLEADDLRQLQNLLGDGCFNNLKDYRDGVIHARHVNAITGVKVDRKAAVYDYLVETSALEKAYDILVIVRKELDEVATLIQGVKALRADGGPGKVHLEAGISDCRARFRDCQRVRQSLPQIPKCPTESELHVADFQAQQAQTAILTGWIQQWPDPIPQRKPPPGIFDNLSSWVPRPPDEPEKK